MGRAWPSLRQGANGGAARKDSVHAVACNKCRVPIRGQVRVTSVMTAKGRVRGTIACGQGQGGVATDHAAPCGPGLWQARRKLPAVPTPPTVNRKLVPSLLPTYSVRHTDRPPDPHMPTIQDLPLCTLPCNGNETLITQIMIL